MKQLMENEKYFIPEITHVFPSFEETYPAKLHWKYLQSSYPISSFDKKHQIV